MVTPYLKPFNVEGGTLYVFPSVSNDLTRTFVSSDYEFKFSHFACLNIPDIYSGVFSDDGDSDPANDLPRGLYIDTLMGSYKPQSWGSADMCKAITENLQNYVMNFETAILNGEGDNDDYDNTILTSVSEKIFWNWMRKVGAIRFNESDTAEDYAGYDDRVVQYIGNIDVMNTVEIGGDTFEELYINIPSSVGASTNVYFRTGAMTDNKNYLNKNYPVANKNNGSQTGNPEIIIGRKPGDSNPYHDYGDESVNIIINSFVDIDTGGNIYTGDVGHTIDFRDSSYDGGGGISNMNAKSLEDFEFNAVLIYYDILEKTSEPGVKRTATNLYGILFLDDVTADASGVASDNTPQGHIQRYPKKKETVYGNGNSYGLKIDLKIDTIGDCNTYRITVPDEDYQKDKVVSFMLYNNALEQLQKCIDFFHTQKNDIVKLRDRVSTLENMTMNIDSIAIIKKDIERLYGMCEGNELVDTATILGLIDANSRKLENIMNGGKDLKLQFDTDVLQPGVGIGLQKSPNKVVINSEQRYSINTVIDGSLTDDTEVSPNHQINTTDTSKVCNIKLRAGENFAVIYINENGRSTTNFNINIDDNEYNWEVGQSLKIYFKYEIGELEFEDTIGNGIVIKPNRDTTISISGAEFEGNNLIEIICIAENTFIHLIK